MASSKIKGITIEIGGNTTKLGQALDGVERQSKDLQKELKGVNSLLKLDPSNVELLQQKQELLTKSIEETKKKQETLVEAMQQIKNGEIEVTEEQYRDLQREIVLTEQKLKKLKNEQEEFGTVAEQRLKAATEKISEYGQKVKTVGQNVSSAGKSMLGLTAGVAAVTTAGVAYNMEMETLEANLGVLLGSTEKANKKLEELRTMGAKTPFETADLVKATQKMLAFGLDADKTNGYLQILGDIAMGDANKLDSLTLAFSQIGASGKASMEDINQMIDQGFNPLTYVAEKTGETMSEVRARVSEGGVSFEEIANAMKDATSEGGTFYNSMNKASQTTAGKISTLKDNFSQMIGTLTDSLMPIFEKIVDKLSEFANWFGRLDSNTKEIIIKISLAVAVLGPLLIILGKIITAISSVMAIAPKIVPIITGIKTVVSALFSLIMSHPIIAIITAVIATIILLWNKCEWFRNLVIGLFEIIKNGFNVVVTFISNGINSIISFANNVYNTVKNVWNLIVTLLSTVAQWIYDNVIVPIMNFFQPFIEWLKAMFQSIWDFISSLFTVIIQLAQGCWNAIVLIWSVVSQWFMDNIIVPITTFFTGLWNTISTAAQLAWNFIAGIWITVSTWFNDIVITPVVNVFTNLWNNLQMGASNAWEGIKSVFSTVATFFKNIFTEAWTAVKNVFSVGGKIFDGIKDGIVSAFTSIVNTIIGGINKVVAIPFNAINTALDKIRNIDILGTKPFKGLIGKISVPQIPKLAKGDVAKPNKPYMAILGDNKKEDEVISPISTMKNTMMDALTDFANMRNAKTMIVQQENRKLLGLLERYLPSIEQIANLKLVLDSDILVGELTPKIDKGLGTLAINKRRGR